MYKPYKGYLERDEQPQELGTYDHHGWLLTTWKFNITGCPWKYTMTPGLTGWDLAHQFILAM